MKFRRTKEVPSEPETPAIEPKVTRYRVYPQFISFGAEVDTDEEGFATIDISNVPSGVTEIRLCSGRSFTPYPFDIDGFRVRHPEATHVRFPYR